MQAVAEEGMLEMVCILRKDFIDESSNKPTQLHKLINNKNRRRVSEM